MPAKRIAPVVAITKRALQADSPRILYSMEGPMVFDLDIFSRSPLVIDLLHLILLAALVVVLVLWLAARARPAASPREAVHTEAAPEPAPVAEAAEVRLQAASPDSALQLLALLQQEARFVDFVHEDLAGFSDADIGAVARVVHEGSRKTLDDYFRIAPLRDEEEESRVSVAAGFDPAEVRLTGNVSGQAPFSGILVHRGWKVEDVRLPKLAEGHNTAIVAAAEVEL